MNKLTKLYLIAPALIFLPMSAMAGTGWYETPDGKNFVLDAGAMSEDILKNQKDILELTGKIKEKGTKGDEGQRGKKGGQGEKGVQGDRGWAGKQGTKGDKGDTGLRGLRGLDGDSLYSETYGNRNLFSVMAIGHAVSNMPAPTSNGFFMSTGFGSSGGQNAGAIGLYYADDAVSYKVTYGRSGHEQNVGAGIGYHF